MPDHKEIYNHHGDQYELLVSYEDYQGNTLPALNRIRSLAGLDVVELGAGTARLTCLLTPEVKSIWAFDASKHMLDVACAKLEKSGAQNWRLGVADHRRLPLADQAADVVISGWSICCLAVWHQGNWRNQVGKALEEMKRVLRPGGTIIILETLGTGHERPHRLAALTDYLAFLEERGFSSLWTRTDFRFESLAKAEELIGFFFGQEMAARVVRENWVIVPECTGFWWHQFLPDELG